MGFNKSFDWVWDKWNALFRYFTIKFLRNSLHSLLSLFGGFVNFSTCDFRKLRAEFCEEIAEINSWALLLNRPPVPMAHGQLLFTLDRRWS
jgi:hypothetical protein